MTEYQNNNQKIGAIFALFPHVLLKTSENPGKTATFNVRNVLLSENVKIYFGFFILHLIFVASYRGFTCIH